MKRSFLYVVFAVSLLFSLAGCSKDELSAVDIKVDGSFESSYSVGSSSSGGYSRMRTGIGF